LHVRLGGSDMGIRDSLWSAATLETRRKKVGISVANAADCDTQISLGEVYNRVELTCELKTVDTAVESPLEGSALTSPYTGRQLYMREYVVEGSGKNGKWNHDKDYPALLDIWAGHRTDHKGAYTRDWLIRVMDHPHWTFPDRHTGDDLIEKYCSGNANQQALPNQLCNQIGACLVSWGNIKEPAYRTDDTVPASVAMSTALVVSVNGNWQTDPATARPTEAQIHASAPVAVYTGQTAGGSYSPTDSDTTNYVVISGSLVLNMLPKNSQAHTAMGVACANREGDGQHGYLQRFFKAASPNVHAVADTDVLLGLQPFTEMDPAEIEYTRSSGGSLADTVGKVPVLRCMLVIGDKCAVETGGDGSIHDFEWRPFKERGECANDAEYYAQSFTIGFNPAIGDKLLGTEYKIRNNITYYLGIEAEGTAIPIKHGDALSGRVRFMVVGPVSMKWNQVTSTLDPWSGGVTGWTDNDILLLPYVSDIIVKDFSVKLMSDNAGDDLIQDCELVYTSDTAETFIHMKDDLTFRIASALTAEERKKLKVADAVRLSTPVVLSTGLGVTEIMDHVKGCAVKPEQSYVDSYYNECRLPRITMRQTLEDRPAVADLFHHYAHPAMTGKKFYAQAIGRNMRANEAVLTLKESWV
ncbi:MAG: hypothetical protein K2F87_00110, partial [Muribaculaceae bacterium]|nr:hypothetical protein [Muribaculaceae bacterium]